MTRKKITELGKIAYQKASRTGIKTVNEMESLGLPKAIFEPNGYYKLQSIKTKSISLLNDQWALAPG